MEIVQIQRLYFLTWHILDVRDFPWISMFSYMWRKIRSTLVKRLCLYLILFRSYEIIFFWQHLWCHTDITHFTPFTEKTIWMNFHTHSEQLTTRILFYSLSKDKINIGKQKSCIPCALCTYSGACFSG